MTRSNLTAPRIKWFGMTAAALWCGLFFAFHHPAIASDASAKDERPLTSEQMGNYMQARIKKLTYDFAGAAQHYKELLDAYPQDQFLHAEALFLFVTAGDFDQALNSAAVLDSHDFRSSFIDNLLIASAFQNVDYQEAVERIEASATLENATNTEPIKLGWAFVGLGEMEQAEQQFNKESSGTSFSWAQFHRALALATIGDFESAEELIGQTAAKEELPPEIAGQLVTAWAQILVQLGRRDDAAALIEQSIAVDPLTAQKRELLQTLRQRIVNGEQVDFDFVSSPSEALAKFFRLIVRVSAADRSQIENTILLARVAEFLEPRNSLNMFEIGVLLADAGSHQLAIKNFDKIAETDPLFVSAQIEKSLALRRLDQKQASIQLLSELAEERGDNLTLVNTLGRGHLGDQNYGAAETAFDQVITLIHVNSPGEDEVAANDIYYGQNWTPFYFRAIARERQGNWPQAKSDLRLAVKYSGGDPNALNYLGYSMLIEGEDPIEAEQLIRDAVKQDPENGAFIDSLGWAQFLQGQYKEALPNLEKAVRLLPNTAEVIDHLGDVYWKVGRQREAKFQWRRALHFDEENLDFERVKRKISLGLDTVLEEEQTIDDSQN